MPKHEVELSQKYTRVKNSVTYLDHAIGLLKKAGYGTEELEEQLSRVSIERDRLLKELDSI